jgi:hypothetical protein
MTYPDSNTNAPRHVDTALRNPSPGRRLNLQLVIVARRLAPDIQLRIRHINAQVRIVLQRLGQDRNAGRRCVLRARRLRGQVRLQAHAVDLEAPGLDELDDAQSALVLRLAVLEVVVVVVELSGWVGFGGHPEGDGHVLLADDAEEDVVAVCAVFVEGSGDLLADSKTIHMLSSHTR